MDQFDLSVFNVHNDDCDPSNYTKCIAMNRLINGLKYHSVLDIIKNENDREIFRHFVMEIYRGFNDDYIHFQEHHHDELEQIYNDLMNKKQFNECHINECANTARHHRLTTNAMNDAVSFDPKINFYKDAMDTLHFHFFHCFEAGIRALKYNVQDDDVDNLDEKSGEYFDESFARMHRNIMKREKHTKSFHRFSGGNTKFTIVTQHKDTDNKNDNDDDLKSDENKRISPSFAMGFRFYYWFFYKDIKQLHETYHGSELNANDHSGFDVMELYIEPKYISLKEEMSNNEHITMKEYEEEVVIKVNEYMKTQRFKKMTASKWSVQYLHYDIKEGDPIRVEHLLSLVLYTDFTNLCSEFSGTFRRKNASEPLKSVIKRNMEYYFMSKYLRECVEVFGQCYQPQRRFETKTFGDCIRGPFFCGMNIVMSLISFNLRLCAPTSTSKQIEVAMKFSGSDGMILQLNNPITFQYSKLHAFNASFISKYKEEDERLFFGGYWFIKIESVIIKSTKHNFEKFIFCLYYLDSMLTGGLMNRLKTTKQSVLILKHLMDTVLNTMTKKVFDEYIYSTFEAFILNKTQIVFNLFQLSRVKDTGIRNLLMNDMQWREYKEEKERQNEDTTNLFKAKAFEIFRNVQSIIFETTSGVGGNAATLSMFALLSLIGTSSVQFIVKAKSDKDDNNWIQDIWSSSSKHLIKSYEEQNYAISIEEKEGHGIRSPKEYWFMINKKT